MRAPIVALLPLALADCQTWSPTWSEVTGRLHESQLAAGSPTIVRHVDGSSPIATDPRQQRQIEPGQRQVVFQDLVRIEPGRHELALSPVRHAPGGIDERIERLALVAEPCKRYYVQARFESATSLSWTPVVSFVEPIPGCSAGAG